MAVGMRKRQGGETGVPVSPSRAHLPLKDFLPLASPIFDFHIEEHCTVGTRSLTYGPLGKAQTYEPMVAILIQITTKYVKMCLDIPIMRCHPEPGNSINRILY